MHRWHLSHTRYQTPTDEQADLDGFLVTQDKVEANWDAWSQHPINFDRGATKDAISSLTMHRPQEVLIISLAS